MKDAIQKENYLKRQSEMYEGMVTKKGKNGERVKMEQKHVYTIF